MCQAWVGAEHQVVEKTHPLTVLGLGGKDYSCPDLQGQDLELSTAFLSVSK